MQHVRNDMNFGTFSYTIITSRSSNNNNLCIMYLTYKKIAYRSFSTLPEFGPLFSFLMLPSYEFSFSKLSPSDFSECKLHTSFPSAGHKEDMANCHSEAPRGGRELHCDQHAHQLWFQVLHRHIQMLTFPGDYGVQP